jgi:hypothetical protein
MPNIGDLVSRLLALVGDAISSSTARLGPAAIAAILLVLLVLLALLARPVTRWATRDLGKLAALPHALAVAAEAGSGAAISLGTSGVARSTTAVSRLQTLAALPLLGHVARVSARAGVPLEVTTNDPLTAHLADAIVAGAHERTGTQERASRSRVAFVGEGRATEAMRALAGFGRAGTITTGQAAPHATSMVLGGVAEEAVLLMIASASGDSSTTFGTADAPHAPSVLLTAEGTLIGPELYDAEADLHPGALRAGVLAGNRIIWLLVATLVVGSILQLAGVDVAAFLVGQA